MTTGPLIMPADVEQLAIDVLTAQFDAHFGGSPKVPVGTRVPNPRPARFLRLNRSGGPRETLISEQAWLILEGWGSDEVEALEVLNFARAVLAAQDGTLFGYGESGGPTNLPDPRTDQIRYTALVTVRARGTALA